ncbi:MAG: hypothetical protein A2008_02130 [Candidatus Wallbacteria bacterium GWC2_49_35]|uniref:TraB/GumN family protein n=1 Tax=Candidatus Wallbacteria bacterium GWC2_49_35 TaxID=1817813 RepID=A0A1F7WPG2_9BACT|nr:MAG: hypothetical protein A2008_02130 [Candidatus Wallbacteria bacterium GWC2_49_35]
MSSCEVFVLESKNSIFNYKNEKEYFLPKETSIKKLIGEEKWNKLVEICRKNSIDGNFENYMPWYLSANLTRPDLVDDECVTMDEYLLSKARKKSMKIFGLETMAMSSLNKIPLEAQIEELENIMANFDEIKSAETKLIDAYNSGKVDALYMIINRRQDENKKKVSEKRYREILVDERNTGWLPAVEKHINGSAAFIAVGVAHLTGDNGIIENLKKRGYKLTEISKPARGSRGK